jgi:plastocyanin
MEPIRPYAGIEGEMRRSIIALLVPAITGASLMLAAETAFAGGGGCHQETTQAAGTSADLTGMCFSPTILYVQPGASVTWTNRDGMRHEIVGTGWSASPTVLEGDQTARQTFSTAGIFPYSCPLHYGMNAVVIVGDGKASVPLALVHPAAAATAATATPHPGTYPWPLLALLAAVAAGALGYGLGRRPTVTRP